MHSFEILAMAVRMFRGFGLVELVCISGIANIHTRVDFLPFRGKQMEKKKKIISANCEIKEVMI